MKDLLDFITHGAETVRWHTTPTLRPQTVGAHSFGVAWLVYVISGPHVRPHLLLAALAHDLPEHHYGDIPAPAKRDMSDHHFPDFRERWDAMERRLLGDIGLDFEQYLTPNEARILKLADVCEYALYVIRERRLGNLTMGRIMERIQKYIEDTIDEEQAREMELATYIADHWIEADTGEHRGR